jgi:phytoene dehydrogenase-like protein
VQHVEAGSVRLCSGEVIQASTVVVAVEGADSGRLLGDESPSLLGQGVTCLYFAADRPPLEEPILVLNGEGRGPVNNLCVPSVMAPTYAPQGQHLVSATVLGATADDDGRLQADVRDHLASWFGPEVNRWRHLRTYSIPYALPRQIPPALAVPERSVRWRPGVYVCGDHRATASIQGAMVSGRRAAEAVLEDRV